MKYLYSWMVILIVACLFSACNTITMFSFDHLIPADTELTLTARTIGVVNNIPEKGETPTATKRGKPFAYGKIGTEALAKALAETSFFNEVVLCDSALNHTTATRQFTAHEIDSLSRVLSVDMLLVLDELPIALHESGGQLPNIPWGISISETCPQITLYHSLEKKLLTRLSIKDTLYWGAGEVDLTTFCTKASHSMAQQLVAKLIPTWKTVDRYFFESGADMRDVALYMREDNWVAALELCKRSYEEDGKEAYRARVAYNCALINERMGHAEEALEWLRKAEMHIRKTPASKEAMMIAQYKNILTERKQQIERLNKQTIYRY